MLTSVCYVQQRRKQGCVKTHKGCEDCVYMILVNFEQLRQ